MTRPLLILVESDPVLREAFQAVAQACGHDLTVLGSLGETIGTAAPQPGDTLVVDLAVWTDFEQLVAWRAGLPAAPRALVLTDQPVALFLRRWGPVDGLEILRKPIEAAALVSLLNAAAGKAT